MAISVATIMLAARTRIDAVSDPFFNDTNTELINWVDQFHKELYDELVAAYGENYFMLVENVSLAADTATLSFATAIGAGELARDVQKLLRLDVVLSSTRVPLRKFEHADEILSDTSYPWDAGTDIAYALEGRGLRFHPIPNAAQTIRFYYVPVVASLTSSSDTIEPSLEPWYEYIVVGVAAEMLKKEGSDPTPFENRKMELRQRISRSVIQRDVGRPHTITDARHVEDGAAHYPYRWW